MITLHIDDQTTTLSAVNNSIALHEYLPATAEQVKITVSGEQPLTITDQWYGQKLICTIVAQQQAPVEYEWRAEAAEHAPKTSREVVIESNVVGSNVNVRCRSLTKDTQRVSLRTVQRHTASHTTSEVTIHGVSDDLSRMDVESMIHISDGIVNVQAHQVHRHLLLTAGARTTSEPMLEVLSDDVKCSHGAAICHLDPQQLFYLQSRGYSQVAAREALVTAFLAA